MAVPSMDERSKNSASEPRAEEIGAVAHGHAGAHLHELRPGVDYLFCETCGHHVACTPLEGDTWEVQCSRCVGECGLCSCRTAKQCLGKDGEPVDFHVHVARSARDPRSQSPNKEVRDV